MTINTQKLLSLFDTAAQTYGWAGGTGTVGQFQTALTNYQKARGDLEQALDAQTAEIARLRDALLRLERGFQAGRDNAGKMFEESGSLYHEGRKVAYDQAASDVRAALAQEQGGSDAT